MTERRVDVRIVERSRTPWGLLWLLLGQYPDDGGEERVGVRVEHVASGVRCTVPARTRRLARELRDRIAEASRTMSDAEVEGWTRTGRWASLG